MRNEGGLPKGCWVGGRKFQSRPVEFPNEFDAPAGHVGAEEVDEGYG